MSYSLWAFSQFSAVSAISRHPLSMVREWPRSAKRLRSVTAVEWRYCLKVEWVTTSGTVWSFWPEMSRRGPRAEFLVFTFAGECGVRLANAASNSGRPGAGMVHASYNCADSAPDSALPNAYRNCASVRETDRFLFAGLPSTGKAARS